jgi:hypothetical protein
MPTPQPLHILLSSRRLEHAPLLAALARGDVVRAGVAATLIQEVRDAGGGWPRRCVAVVSLIARIDGQERPELETLSSFAAVSARPPQVLLARRSEPAFSLHDLPGSSVITEDDTYGEAVLAVACLRQGVDAACLPACTLATAGESLRASAADYLLTRPSRGMQRAAQEDGYLVARLGDATGALLTSTLDAPGEWVQGDEAVAFMHAYEQARAWVATAPPGEVAGVLRDDFADVPHEILTRAVSLYQGVGCWRGASYLQDEELDASVLALDSALASIRRAVTS